MNRGAGSGSADREQQAPQQLRAAPPGQSAAGRNGSPPAAKEGEEPAEEPPLGAVRLFHLQGSSSEEVKDGIYNPSGCA